VDWLTKTAHFEACKTTVSAKDVADIFVQNIFGYHGLPRKIISDRDSCFTSKFWKAIMKTLDVKLGMSTAFHPQTDGQTERTNRTLEDMMRIYSNKSQDDWDKLLPLLEFAYHNSVNPTTKMTPFFLDTGKDPIVPQTLLGDKISSENPTAEGYINEIRNNIRIALDNIKEAQERQEHYANRKRKEVTFTEDMVMLDAKNLRRKPKSNSRKLLNRFIGPFEVERVVSKVAYKLKFSEKMKIHPVFHVSLLKKYE
jgi:hypothetical protein